MNLLAKPNVVLREAISSDQQEKVVAVDIDLGQIGMPWKARCTDTRQIPELQTFIARMRVTSNYPGGFDDADWCTC